MDSTQSFSNRAEDSTTHRRSILFKQTVLGKFFPNGERIQLIDLLFSEAGIDLPEERGLDQTHRFFQSHLAEIRGATKACLSKDQNAQTFSALAFTNLAYNLGLVNPALYKECYGMVDMLVLVPGTYEEVKKGLSHAVTHCDGVGKVLVMANHRFLTNSEVQAVGKFVNCDGATAAMQAIIDSVFPHDTFSFEVQRTKAKKKGKLARFDESLSTLFSTLAICEKDFKIVFVIPDGKALRLRTLVQRQVKARELDRDGWEPEFMVVRPVEAFAENPSSVLLEIVEIVSELVAESSHQLRR